MRGVITPRVCASTAGYEGVEMREDLSEDTDRSTAGKARDAWTNRAGERTETLAEINVKTEWDGTTMYLPTELRENLELVYQELSLECRREYGVEMQKLRDFYPYVIELGLEELSKRNAEDVLSDQLHLVEGSDETE